MSLPFPWHVIACPVSTPCLCFIKRDSLQSATIFLQKNLFWLREMYPSQEKIWWKAEFSTKVQKRLSSFSMGATANTSGIGIVSHISARLIYLLESVLHFQVVNQLLFIHLTTANVVQIYCCTSYFPNIQLLSWITHSLRYSISFSRKCLRICIPLVLHIIFENATLQ